MCEETCEDSPGTGVPCTATTKTERKAVILMMSPVTGEQMPVITEKHAFNWQGEEYIVDYSYYMDENGLWYTDDEQLQSVIDQIFEMQKQRNLITV